MCLCVCVCVSAPSPSPFPLSLSPLPLPLSLSSTELELSVYARKRKYAQHSNGGISVDFGHMAQPESDSQVLLDVSALRVQSDIDRANEEFEMDLGLADGMPPPLDPSVLNSNGTGTSGAPAGAFTLSISGSDSSSDDGYSSDSSSSYDEDNISIASMPMKSLSRSHSRNTRMVQPQILIRAAPYSSPPSDQDNGIKHNRRRSFGSSVDLANMYTLDEKQRDELQSMIGDGSDWDVDETEAGSAAVSREEAAATAKRLGVKGRSAERHTILPFDRPEDADALRTSGHGQLELNDDDITDLAEYMHGTDDTTLDIKQLVQTFVESQQDQANSVSLRPTEDETTYMFGTRKLHLNVMAGRLMVRIGGGWQPIGEYVSKHTASMRRQSEHALAQAKSSPDGASVSRRVTAVSSQKNKKKRNRKRKNKNKNKNQSKSTSNNNDDNSGSTEDANAVIHIPGVDLEDLREDLAELDDL
jgi:Growth-Arrest-Specific Protein 2 Domain